MLLRSHDDATNDDDRWRAFVAATGFGHFVAAGRDRSVPVIVPTQFTVAGDRVLFHLARQNPVFEALGENSEAIMSVAGDWAYIPAAWKAIGDEDPRRGVPTTYYAAVQLRGTTRVLDGSSEVASVLTAQLDDLEPQADLIDPIEHGPLLNGIRAIVLEVGEVRAKFKYGGNADDAHRAQIAERLADRDGPGDAAARSQMR